MIIPTLVTTATITTGCREEVVPEETGQGTRETRGVVGMAATLTTGGLRTGERTVVRDVTATAEARMAPTFRGNCRPVRRFLHLCFKTITILVGTSITFVQCKIFFLMDRISDH